MKLLIDVGVGRAVENDLRSKGHDVAAIRDIDPRMTDPDILNLAVREKRLVLTMDKDFGELVHFSGRAHCGVLLLRLEDAAIEEKRHVVGEIMDLHEEELMGRFSVYQNGQLRIRP